MKDSIPDIELLGEFLRTRSDQTFADLVRRYVDLVYATARRLVGDGPLAERLIVRIADLVKPGEDYVGVLTIGADGTIDVPPTGIGPIKVAGLRSDEIEAVLIEKSRGKIFAHPERYIRVDRFFVGAWPAFGQKLIVSEK